MNSGQRRKSMTTLTAVATACLSCGSGGKGGGDDQSGGGNKGGRFNLRATNVTGRFVLGNTTTAADGYDLWIFNHTHPNLEEMPLDSDGGFRVPLEHFAEHDTYSMHLLKDFIWVGDLDLANASAGVQPAFVYQGGLGFNMSSVRIPVDSRGLPHALTTGIPADIGGGFSLSPTTRASFSDYLIPGQVTKVAFSSQLFVFDAPTLLYSFYGRSTYPSAYTRDLKRLYRVGALVVAADETEVTDVALSRTGSWRNAARTSADDAGAPEAASLLGDLPQTLSKTKPGRYEMSVFSGGMVDPNTVAVFKIRPNSGAEVPVPRRVARLLSMPPQVTAVSTSGGTPAAVDYSVSSVSNGLTLPFCRSGEVVLDIQPPLDETGAAVAAANFDRIEVFFDYYKDSSQRTTKMAVDPSWYPAPYAVAKSDTTLTDLARAWDPGKQQLTFTLGSSEQDTATQQLRMWPELFSPASGGNATTAIRLRISYRSDGEGTAAGAVVWLKNGC